MAGHPGLDRVQDPATRACLKALFDRVNPIPQRVTDIQDDFLKPGATTTSMRKTRLTNVVDAVDLSDAVTLRQLREIMMREVPDIVTQVTTITIPGDEPKPIQEVVGTGLLKATWTQLFVGGIGTGTLKTLVKAPGKGLIVVPIVGMFSKYHIIGDPATAYGTSGTLVVEHLNFATNHLQVTADFNNARRMIVQTSVAGTYTDLASPYPDDTPLIVRFETAPSGTLGPGSAVRASLDVWYVIGTVVGAP